MKPLRSPSPNSSRALRTGAAALVCGAALALAPPAGADGRAPLTVRSTDFHPNPAWTGIPGRTLDSKATGKIEQLGEVVILEGDASSVTDDGMGNYGLTYSNTRNDLATLTHRFYTQYGDEFDELIILTTFDDNGAAGALAYEVSTKVDVDGIGQQLGDDDPTVWGATQGKLHAFVNMMRWDQYKGIDGLDVTDLNSGFYSTLGQEFAHRWLSFLLYTDKTGAASDAMLGRDLAHWASTLQADASVMDGNRWVDNRDGSFTDVETFARYSQLDLYAMGLIDAAEVKPWYVIKDAVEAGSHATIDPKSYLRLGTRVEGNREDIGIDQVISANGPRKPGYAEADRAFRVAFVVVTRPGEKAGDVSEIARAVDVIRTNWEKSFDQYTGGRGKMCTQVSAPCGSPTARLVSGVVAERGGNHNGVVEPGEPVTVDFTVVNDGPISARGVTVAATDTDIPLVAAAPADIAELASGQRVDVAWSGDVPATAPCGQPLTVHGTSTVDGHRFRGYAQVVPGLTSLFKTAFDHDGGLFGANQRGDDTTTKNPWQYGQPVEYRSPSGWTFQPSACHGGSRCWFTGLEAGHRPMTDSGVGVGATTLWSPEYDLSAAYQPKLRYWVWFQAVDFSNPQLGGMVASSVSLSLQYSIDGGKTWNLLDTVGGAEPTWRMREPRLAGKLDGAKTLRLRWTASSTADNILVEAGVDDVEVQMLTPACNPAAAITPTTGTSMDSGCSCAVAARAPARPGSALAVAIVLLLGGALTLRRRRAAR